MDPESYPQEERELATPSLLEKASGALSRMATVQQDPFAVQGRPGADPYEVYRTPMGSSRTSPGRSNSPIHIRIFFRFQTRDGATVMKNKMADLKGVFRKRKGRDASEKERRLPSLVSNVEGNI